MQIKIVKGHRTERLPVKPAETMEEDYKRLSAASRFYETIHAITDGIKMRIQEGDHQGVSNQVAILGKVADLPGTDRSIRKLITASAQVLENLSRIPNASTQDVDKAMRGLNHNMHVIQGTARDHYGQILHKARLVNSSDSTVKRDPLFMHGTQFAKPSSPEAEKLKAMLRTKNYAVGKAPVVFILQGMISADMLKGLFKYELIGQNLVLQDQIVAGANTDFAEDHELSGATEAAELVAATWIRKKGRPHEIIVGSAKWEGAIWCAVFGKAEHRALSQAMGGNFKFRQWGLAFQDVR